MAESRGIADDGGGSVGVPVVGVRPLRCKPPRYPATWGFRLGMVTYPKPPRLLFAGIFGSCLSIHRCRSWDEVPTLPPAPLQIFHIFVKKPAPCCDPLNRDLTRHRSHLLPLTWCHVSHINVIGWSPRRVFSGGRVHGGSQRSRFPGDVVG